MMPDMTWAADTRRESGIALRGRTRECALLDDLLSAVRRGEGRTLMVRGAAGIGKTALVEHLSASASDSIVVRVSGVESESELAWAGLHQLCAPLLDRLEEPLPAPQRQAVDVAFGRTDGEGPNRFLVGLAALSLLKTAAAERPLLCLVDDAQWLDRLSTLTLAFVTRRVAADPMGIIFASRDRISALRHLPELEVHGVRAEDARALLDSGVPFKLDERVRETILAETRGNPRALLEWSRGWAATELAGGFGLPGRRSLTGRIEHGLGRRLEGLSDDSRLLLLLAAADPSGDPLLLWRAAKQLLIQPAAVEAAQRDGLVAIGERVTFGHPVLRATLYGSATAEDRRRIHLALAEATDPGTDPERRAWHLAAAAAGPEEQTASALERSAEQAQKRGGFAASAAFLQRAVALTSDQARRADRALAAAQASQRAGAFEEALNMLTMAESGPRNDFRLARVAMARADVTHRSFLGPDAPAQLLDAARQLERSDVELARRAYLSAWGAACRAGRLARERILPTICSRVRALPRSEQAPSGIEQLLDGLVLLKGENHAAAVPALQRAKDALTDLALDEIVDWGPMAVCASALVWDFDSMFALSARHVQVVRDAGALAALPASLSNLGLATAWTGDFLEAASLVAEAGRAAAVIGSPLAPYTLLRLQALRGNEAEVSTLRTAAVEIAESNGQGMLVEWGHWAAAVLYNGRGRYEEAASAALQATSSPSDWWTLWVLPELVEGAARLRDGEVARDALEQLSATTRPCGTDLALGIEARSRALLSDGGLAEELYREAINRLSRTKLRPELARAHLMYGEWLRRENRRTDAREQLHAANSMFVSMGMEAFAERTRRERIALGDRVRNRAEATTDGLTSQERLIAGLANDGLSNSEIGGQLFLSARTVEWHLRNVFIKLDIRCRRDLAAAFAS